jgi:UDP-glucuronate 4-epimerase
MKKIKQKVLITGCAGFIGFHLCKRLLDTNQFSVIGLDNLNNYYDTKLKKDRLNILKKNKKNFNFHKVDLTNFKKLNNVFKINKFDAVVNLAAQAGVRYSISNPNEYYQSNIKGFYNLLDLCKTHNAPHLLFASTSSVYGNNKKFPIKEEYNTDRPLSFYAATKKCNELMAYSYSNIYKLPITGMRFFTVYGPMGRPDMSLFKFTKLISEGKKIDLYNKGDHVRDFTYIDDITESIVKLLNKKSKKTIPYQVVNVCSSNPVRLKKFINEIEKNLSTKSKTNNMPKQLGDVHKTHGDNTNISKLINYSPNTKIEIGIKNFVKWYKEYYN